MGIDIDSKMMVGVNHQVSWDDEEYDSYIEWAEDQGLTLAYPYYDCPDEEASIGIEVPNCDDSTQDQFVEELSRAFIEFENITGQCGTLKAFAHVI